MNLKNRSKTNKNGKISFIVVLDIDRPGDFFVDDQMLEFPVYSASGEILLNGNPSGGFSERNHDRVYITDNHNPFFTG